MNIFEYQVKQLFKEFGIPVPESGVATTPEEAREVARMLGPGKYVIKAQVDTEGRGKAGGIKYANTPAEAAEAARQLIGMTLVTMQTGPEGRMVLKVLVEKIIEAADKLYMAAVLDKAAQKMAMVVSPEGGINIEDVAAKNPESIFFEQIVPDQTLWPFDTRKLFAASGLAAGHIKQAELVMQNLVRLVLEKEMTLAEINPLAITGEGTLLALDAKLAYDEGILLREPYAMVLRDPEDRVYRRKKIKAN
jgi:succinyl-CoA synthetase beta subunit